ncbi:MAG: hypothetical protein WCK63_02930 [Betaproteobacteria bacterium]
MERPLELAAVALEAAAMVALLAASLAVATSLVAASSFFSSASSRALWAATSARISDVASANAGVTENPADTRQPNKIMLATLRFGAFTPLFLCINPPLCLGSPVDVTNCTDAIYETLTFKLPTAQRVHLSYALLIREIF